jgi:hypothetical protein
MSRHHLVYTLGVVALLGALAQACGGDGLMTGTTTGGTGGGGGSTTSTTTTSSTGGMGGKGGSGGTGGSLPQAEHGPAATDFVNAGDRTKSGKYVLDSTLGQSTQNQGRSQSANYVLQGGLVGANGSFK